MTAALGCRAAIGATVRLRRLAALGLACLLLTARNAAAESHLESRLAEMGRALATAFPQDAPAKVAVIDFADLNGHQSALGKFVAEELTTQLAIQGRGRLTVIERRHLMSVLAEQKLSSSNLFDPESVEKIGRILGVQAIVTGSITDLGAELKVHARVLSVQSGQVIDATSVSIPADETTRYLVRQVPGLPNEISGARSASGAQPSSAYFENRFLRAVVDRVGVSADRKSVTVALQLTNQTDEDVMIALFDPCRVMLVDDSGTEAFADARDHVAGLSCVPGSSWAEESTRYTQISPRSTTVVTLQFRRDQGSEDSRTFDATIKGRSAALSMDMARFEGKSWSRFSVGITNIALGP
jgi:TolB-like protein